MDNNNSPKFEYDIQKRAQSGVKATFRVVVAAYIAYLGYKLIRDAEASWTIVVGAVFIAAALAFCVYAWKRWRIDLEAARLPDEDETDEGKEDETDEENEEENKYEDDELQE